MNLRIGAIRWIVLNGMATVGLAYVCGCERSAHGPHKRDVARPDTAAVAMNEATAAQCARYGCEVRLKKLVTLGDRAAPGLFGERAFVQRTGRNRYWATTIVFDKIAAFDSMGAFVGSVGRRGAGPGEFQFAMLTGVGTSDSVFVHDNRLGRVTVIDDSLQYVRSFRFRYFPQLRTGDGSFVVAEQIRTPENIGMPVHLISAEGAIIKSFGIDTPQFRPDLRFLLSRVVGTAPDGNIWLAAPGRFQFEKRNPRNGTRLATLRPDATWFRETVRDPGHPLVQRPTSLVTQLREDSKGCLWVFVTEADSEWKQRWSREPAAETEEFRLHPEDYESAFDWRIIVLDASTGRQVATLRSGTEMWTRPPSNVIITRHSAAADEVAFDVWEALLTVKEAQQ